LGGCLLPDTAQKSPDSNPLKEFRRSALVVA
jgi:hypothetical protein